jgi:hypothetical protein
MEVHAPEKPPHSLKEMFLQLLIVTIGILLALSLESVVEWRHNRALVREAREKLAQEISDNKRSVDDALKDLPAIIEGHKRALQFINDRLAHRTPSVKQISVSYSLVPLSDASWRTAQATGVLGHMAYAEVQKYTDVYALQAEAMRLQQRTLDSAIAELQWGEFQRLDEFTPAELETWKQQALATLAGLNFERSLATALSAAYQEALTGMGLAAPRPQPRELAHTAPSRASRPLGAP